MNFLLIFLFVVFKCYLYVISLLHDCKARTYRELFHELKHYANRLKIVFNPNTITNDFEKVLVKVLADKVRIFTHLFKEVEIHSFCNLFVFGFHRHDMPDVIFILHRLSIVI